MICGSRLGWGERGLPLTVSDLTAADAGEPVSREDSRTSEQLPSQNASVIQCRERAVADASDRGCERLSGRFAIANGDLLHSCASA
ncbi:conserved hypothetical protein [Actinomyces sp. oral taxon 180 str. F0310]|nr:conserved hypothetical protein [Actinomyces sp. oral taxon 180 str. F0310]